MGPGRAETERRGVRGKQFPSCDDPFSRIPKRVTVLKSVDNGTDRAAFAEAAKRMVIAESSGGPMVQNVKKILAPVDFSELSMETMRGAMELAKDVGAEVNLVLVVAPHNHYLPPPLASHAEHSPE